MRSLKNIITSIVIICIILMLIIPLPQIFLEVIFVIELLLGILLYVYSKNTFVENTQRRIPYFVLIYNLIILSVSVSIVRFCFTTKDFPIRYISFLYESNNISSLFGFIFSICIFVSTIYDIQKGKKTIKVKYNRFLEHQSEDSDKDNIDFYSEVDGLSEFLVGNLIFSILNLLCVIIVGAFFNVIMSGEAFFNAIIYSIKNGVSFVFVAFLPLLLSSRVLSENLTQFEQREMVDKIIDRER